MKKLFLIFLVLYLMTIASFAVLLLKNQNALAMLVTLVPPLVLGIYTTFYYKK